MPVVLAPPCSGKSTFVRTSVFLVDGDHIAADAGVWPEERYDWWRGEQSLIDRVIDAHDRALFEFVARHPFMTVLTAMIPDRLTSYGRALTRQCCAVVLIPEEEHKARHAAAGNERDPLYPTWEELVPDRIAYTEFAAREGVPILKGFWR